MGKNRKTNYKCCFVSKCKNSTVSTPDKVFFNVPRDAKIRKQWCKAIMKTKELSANSCLNCCEDHFDIKEDTMNHMEYTLMKAQGEKVSLRLKKEAIPHIFICQNQNLPSPIVKNGTSKRQKLALASKALSGQAGKRSKVLKSRKPQTNVCKTVDKSNYFEIEPIQTDDSDVASETHFEDELHGAKAVKAKNRSVCENVTTAKSKVMLPTSVPVTSPGTPVTNNRLLTNNPVDDLCISSVRSLYMKVDSEDGDLNPETPSEEMQTENAFKSTEISGSGNKTAVDDPEHIVPEVTIKIEPLPTYEVQNCSESHNEINSFRLICAQCRHYELCAACEARGAHAAHYVLRVPADRPLCEVERVVEAVRRELIATPSDDGIERHTDQSGWSSDCDSRSESPGVKIEKKEAPVESFSVKVGIKEEIDLLPITNDSRSESPGVETEKKEPRALAESFRVTVEVNEDPLSITNDTESHSVGLGQCGYTVPVEMDSDYLAPIVVHNTTETMAKLDTGESYTSTSSVKTSRKRHSPNLSTIPRTPSNTMQDSSKILIIKKEKKETPDIRTRGLSQPLAPISRRRKRPAPSNET